MSWIYQKQHEEEDEGRRKRIGDFGKEMAAVVVRSVAAFSSRWRWWWWWQLLLLLLLSAAAPPCHGSVQTFRLLPDTRGSQMNWIDNSGIHLLSKNSEFGFGFTTSSASDTTSYLLAVIHMGSKTVVWAANDAAPVSHSDDFVFDKDGNAYLQSGSAVVWSTNTSGKGATAMVLQDSGNLVVQGTGDGTLWESFSYPTDTLLSGQTFAEGMSLQSKPSKNNLRYRLVIEGGDMKLYADFRTPQQYWSLQKDTRKIINKGGGVPRVHYARLSSSSWDFYDVASARSPLWQFITAVSSGDGNLTWTAVLGNDGFISFFSLPVQDQPSHSSTQIPQDACDAPEHCAPYNVCYPDRCQCPAVLGTNCDRVVVSPCDAAPLKLAKVDDGVGYFATQFVGPTAKLDLKGCQDACTKNCSCVALFHRNGSNDCYLFDQIGSLQHLEGDLSGYVGYIKLPEGEGDSNGNGGGSKHTTIIVVVISLATAAVIAALIYFAVRIQRRRSLLSAGEASQASSDEDNFLESISSMPVRFRYRDLQEATDNFSQKLGQGGFGSVYLGKLPDGTRVAVKKLEGIGQGKKEFRSEVTIIGSIHHIHLVKLRGFCAEGTHRLLAYEYMANGSLDRWIFKSKEGSSKLDWDKRYSIALGTAKGLTYLHEDCESKIIHCDIKPENVLLDDNFVAKVSDFGLAKLMTREQSHVFTTLRGTRGYLAPEWITNYAISEKSDVYSFGMVLLELIGGRKNYDPSENSEKSHFPSYAFKKMEEGKLKEVFDERLDCNDKDERIETAIKVALWCIQEDMSLRPSMAKVVQMLEGIQCVPEPPTSSHVGFRMYPNILKSISEDGGTSSGPSDCNSDAFLSAVRLSGPR